MILAAKASLITTILRISIGILEYDIRRILEENNLETDTIRTRIIFHIDKRYNKFIIP
jgi:hypothetical protein